MHASEIEIGRWYRLPGGTERAVSRQRLAFKRTDGGMEATIVAVPSSRAPQLPQARRKKQVLAQRTFNRSRGRLSRLRCAHHPRAGRQSERRFDGCWRSRRRTGR
jgi:hypothetical protein